MINIPMKVTDSYNRSSISSLSQPKIQPALNRQTIGSASIPTPDSISTAGATRPGSSTAGATHAGSSTAGATHAGSSTLGATRPGTTSRQQAARTFTPEVPTPQTAPAALKYRKPPALRNLVQKGQKVNIGTDGQLKGLKVAMGWNTSNPRCDIDLSAFLLGPSGKVPGDDWFVFYGQTDSPDGSVSLDVNGSAEDREVAYINLAKLSPGIKKIVFVLTINEALAYRLNFSMVKDAYIRILVTDTRREIYSFLLTDYYANVTSMMLGELYLYNGTWKFNAIGNGVAKDLAGLCELYGVQTN